MEGLLSRRIRRERGPSRPPAAPPPGATSPAAPETAPAQSTENTPHENKWVVSLAVVFGVLMSTIDTSVVNVAFPTIQGNVGATQQEITWITTGYLISVVILMPLTNWLSVRFGRKNIYLVSLVIFTAASVMCGLSTSLGELIFWRVVQGLGAGPLQPLAQAIFREAFPPEQQGIAMAVFGVTVLSGPAIGPTLGGYITDNFNWPWIFFINLPIGIIGFLVALSVLHDPPYMRGNRKLKVDAAGIGLLAVTLASMQTVLEEGQADYWFESSFIVTLTVISAVTLIGFIWWELVHDNPAVDLRLFKNATFSAGTIIGGILGIGLFASLFLLPQYMQVLLGFNATQSGLTLMPRSLTMIFMMPVAGVLYNRLGPRPMISAGLLLSAYAQWIMSRFTLQTGVGDILTPQIIQGIGFALIFVSLSTAVLSTIDRPHLTSASGLNNLIRQLGGSFGTAFVVTILTRHAAQSRAALVENASPGNLLFMRELNGLAGTFVHQGYSADAARQMALTAINGLIQRQAAMIAYDYVFLWIGLLFAACVPLVIFLKAPSARDLNERGGVAMMGE